MDIELSTALLFILVPAAIGAITMLINDRRGAYAMSVFGSVLIWLSVLGASRATTRPLETVAPWLENLGLNIYMVLDTNIVWLDRVDANFLFEVDAFALGLIAMTTLVTFAASTFGFIAGRERPGVYHGLLWLTAAAVMGLFVARDLLAFYMFFELMLIPVFFLLGIWGGADRIRATLTLVIYTVVGSLIMLVALIGMGLQAGTFDIAAIAIQVGEARAAGADGLFADWMFWSVMIAIAIKAPLVPFHAWQPLAYRQAGAEVTALLSGVISKAAMVTGLVILLPLTPSTW